MLNDDDKYQELILEIEKLGRKQLYFFSRVIVPIILIWSFCIKKPVDPIKPDDPDPPTLIEAPILSEPKPAEIISLNGLVFQWQPVENAKEYCFILSKEDSLFEDISKIILITYTDTTVYTIHDENIKSKFQNGATYYWRIRAIDPEGRWSVVFHFTIDTQGPDAPTLTNPLDESRIRHRSPVFKWSNGAAAYQLLVANNPEFMNPMIQEDSLILSEYPSSTPLPDDTYYWKVRGMDDIGNWGDWSEPWTFTIDTRGPDAPVLMRPENESIISDNTPDFDWSDSAAAYKLMVADNVEFTNPFFQEDSLTLSEYISGTPLPDKQYYWKVQAMDELGNWGAWSDTWTFIIDTQGPDAPILMTPLNGMLISDHTPNFDWSDNAAAYTLLVDDNSEFSHPMIQEDSITISEYTPDLPLMDKTYYWKVRAMDRVGNWGAWSDTWTFIIDTRGPDAPTLVAPLNESTISNNTPYFDWTNGSEGYHLLVADNSDFTYPMIQIDSLILSEYATDAPLPDKSYYWKVRGKDELGNWGDWSDTWVFTIDTQGPDAPVLLAPLNESTISDNTPEFDWSDCAIEYNLFISENASFTNPIIQENNLTISEFAPGVPLSNGTYYWKVQGMDDIGNLSDWSSTWFFTIDTQPPDPPLLTDPRNESKLNTNTPSLQWTDNAAAYKLIVADNDEFSNPLIQEDNLTVSVYAISSQLPEGTYYWKVQAGDEIGNWSDWSEIWCFTINPFLEMVYVPAGEFIMGSDQGDPDELPIHTVYLDAYYINKYEVTNEQYVAYLNEMLLTGAIQASATTVTKDGDEILDLDHPACQIRFSNGRFKEEDGKDNHPVVEVTWYGAKSFAEYYGKRLPTEAEWEKAARGTDARKYPWGNTEPTPLHCNFNDLVGESTPVGQYSPTGDSPYGCCDMGGNAWERCADWYGRDYYSDSSANHNPQGPPSGEHRVFRGGHWQQWSWDIRCSNRPMSTPGQSYGYYGIGFRCVQDP